MPHTIEVKQDSPNRKVPLEWAREIVRQTLNAEKSKPKLVSVFLTGDKEIRNLNKKYLNHDWPTDVISLGCKDGSAPGVGADYLGDVLISVETAQSVAREIGVDWHVELARYLVHGTLHLLGYDDQEPEDREKMFSRQEKIVKNLIVKIPKPLPIPSLVTVSKTVKKSKAKDR